MKSVGVRTLRNASLLAALAVPFSAASAPLINVHTIGDSLVLGSEADAREYVRDFYGYGQQSGDSSDPGDSAYNPTPFIGWRAEFQRTLADVGGVEVNMVGTTSSVSDLPDTRINTSTLQPATFTTSDGRTYTYDSDHNGQGGWRIGGSYNLANINGNQDLVNLNGSTGNGGFAYTPGQIPFSTFDNGPIDISGPGTDVIDTGNNGLTADGANTFDRGIREHIPEMAEPLGQADVVILAIGVNDVKNREDVEGSGSNVFERVQNGAAQQRLYELILDIKASVDADTEIYVANIATVNDSFDWNTTADAQAAIEGFNTAFREDYFGAAYEDFAGYTNAIVSATEEADPEGLLDNVFLLNVHGQIDDLIGRDPGDMDFSRALSADNLHWSEEGYDAIGQFYGDIIAANSAFIPEPSSGVLLLAGLGLLASRYRRAG
ncbi:MAG: PEP-CTERM sorting domain-containing protein [Planctomycetota bacterium]